MTRPVVSASLQVKGMPSMDATQQSQSVDILRGKLSLLTDLVERVLEICGELQS